jgi:hypothetical protein
VTKPIRVLALVGNVAAAGCIASPTSVDVLGLWGGLHVSLQVTSAGGHLEYDCADGVIEGPIRPDRAGRFTAVGTHTPGRGGPIRVGEILPAFRARYDGEVDGERMNLLVTLVDTEVVLGPFQLQRGSSGRLVRCL